MRHAMPPLSALRAFEAAARHLSLTKAAQELGVTPGALSHQIRGLEQLLGFTLFNRGVRSIALTPKGKQLYPGLQTGFGHIREAVAALMDADAERNLPVDAATDGELVAEKLVAVHLVAVCSPKLMEMYGAFATPEALKEVPLIHDESLAHRAELPTWVDWFKAAGVDGVDVSRGLRFSSADHALDATVEGAGVLLTHDVLAYDEVRTGRLVTPFELTLPSGRAYYFVCPQKRQNRPHVRAFRDWIKQEVAALDWEDCVSRSRRPRGA